MSDTRLPVDWTTAQPYEQWRVARESGCPVIETEGGLGPGIGYQVTDWEHVESVLRDPETFSSEQGGTLLQDLPVAGTVLSMMDDPVTPASAGW